MLCEQADLTMLIRQYLVVMLMPDQHRLHSQQERTQQQRDAKVFFVAGYFQRVYLIGKWN
jgi:hypothetical protein